MKRRVVRVHPVPPFQQTVSKMAWKRKKGRKALYGQFYEGVDGALYGMTEHSFSMGCSRHRIAAYPVEKGKRDHRQTFYPCHNGKPFQVKTDEGETVMIKRSFLVRLSKKSCPIKLNFDERRAMASGSMKSDKYLWRNIPFSVVAESEPAR